MKIVILLFTLCQGVSYMMQRKLFFSLTLLAFCGSAFASDSSSSAASSSSSSSAASSSSSSAASASSSSSSAASTTHSVLCRVVDGQEFMLSVDPAAATLVNIKALMAVKLKMEVDDFAIVQHVPVYRAHA